MRAAVLGVAAILACAGLAACGEKEEAEGPPAITVDVAPVLVSSIQQTIRTDAVIYPRQQSAIVPKLSAPIHALRVQRGARVRAGQVLVELESRDLASAAAESRAAATQAEATYETTARATVPQGVQKAELDVRAAKDALDAQQAAFDNRQALFKEGAIAGKDVNDAQVALSQARAQYEEARKVLEDLQGFARDQAIKAAAAQRDAARAHDQAVQAQLSYASLVSPIDGVVTDLPFYPGETAPSGAPVVTVMDLSRVVARAHVAQTDAALLRVGNAASIIGPGNVPVDGKVTQISPALDPGSTTVEIWVEADNKDGRLKPGSSARVELVAKTVPDALVIPDTAVVTAATGSTFVIVVDKDNKPHVRKVSVGVRDSGNAQITEGLDNGLRVATTGAYEVFTLDEEVRDGLTVKIAPPKEDAEDPDEN